MQPNRILPDLQCSLLCEDIRQEVTGNFILIGVVNFIRVPQLPVTIPRLLFFNRWAAGLGEFNESVRLIGPDQVTALGECNMKFSLRDPATHAINVAIFGNITLKIPGVHFVEVLVDDVMKIRYPLSVLLAPPAGQTHPPAENQPPPDAP